MGAPIQRLLEIISRYDREVEPVLLQIDSLRFDLKPFLDALMERWMEEHGDDPEFVETIHRHLERISVIKTPR